MDIFLGAEIDGPAAGKWFALQKAFSESLSVLGERNYGESLTSIGIISIIMPTEFFEDGGYKERRFYSAQRKAADIRLQIGYTDFVKADNETRKRIYRSHILEAVRIAATKAGSGLDGSRLLRDVEQLLEQT